MSKRLTIVIVRDRYLGRVTTGGCLIAEVAKYKGQYFARLKKGGLNPDGLVGFGSLAKLDEALARLVQDLPSDIG